MRNIKEHSGEQNLWPKSIEKVISEGLDNVELKQLVQVQERRLFNSPWLFWTTEVYSFGRCFREWLSWPRFLAIPIYGDHGVSESGVLAPHEQKNPSKYYFVWSQERYSYAQLLTKKKLLRVPHPWVTYRHKKGYLPTTRRQGTLVFFPHTTTAVVLDNYPIKQYVQELLELPRYFYPIVLCLHMHDINKGLHQILRQYNFPIVSVGNTLSPFFVDRFYNLLSNFRYATSPLGGSELFYCYEFGIQYFIYGLPPEHVNNSDENLPDGRLERLDIVYQKTHDLKMRLFKNTDPMPSAEKTDFVIDMLGLNSTVKISRIRLIMLMEFARLLPYFSLKILSKVARKSKLFIKSI